MNTIKSDYKKNIKINCNNEKVKFTELIQISELQSLKMKFLPLIHPDITNRTCTKKYLHVLTLEWHLNDLYMSSTTQTM